MATALRHLPEIPASTREPFLRILSSSVCGASLGMFRMFFGIVMLLEAISITRPMASAAGSVPLKTYFTSPEITFHLPYAGFEWLPLLPPTGIHLVVAILALGSIALAAGVAHRFAATVVFVAWGYLFTVESTRTYWMSYYYLELIFSFLIIFLPADRRYSLRSLFAKTSSSRKNDQPAPAVPYWSIFLLRLQLVITYFYAGIAKINADWLLDAQPVRRFLSDAAKDAPQFLHPLLNSLPFAYFLSWSGAAFDLSVGFLLLARRTRVLGFLLLALFHSTNHLVLFDDIVWFPLLGLLSATIFFNPDWPTQFANWLRKPFVPRPDRKWLIGGVILIPVLGAALAWKAKPPARIGQSIPLSRLSLSLLTAWLFIQLLLPLRHFLIPGDVRMTFEGLSCSWRLKAEFYSAKRAEITIKDSSVLSSSPDHSTHVIQWRQWPGEKVFHRLVDRSNLNWTNLPEVLVIFEPRVGERVFYNPVAGGRNRSEQEAAAQALKIWQERFGRVPQISRTFPRADILKGYFRSLQARGLPVPNPAAPEGVAALNASLYADPAMRPVVKRLHPFGTENVPVYDHQFLLIEDPQLERKSGSGPLQIDRTQWRFGPEQSTTAESIQHQDGQALSIFLLDETPETIALLPREFIGTTPDRPLEPRILWNSFKDAPVSKVMHISTNPFLLRRYAVRIARLWKEKFGTQPQVFAETSVSLNGRPPQSNVDPSMDLASARASYLTHNPWIKDLVFPRIPQAP